MDLEAIAQEVLQEIAAVADEPALEAIRLKALGKKGFVTAQMKELGAMDPQARKQAGAALNLLKTQIEEAISAVRKNLTARALQQRLASEYVDVSLPIARHAAGSIHPVSQVYEEIIQIFGQLGFLIAEGPHIEDDFHNFTALNIPPEHPARQEHDSFYFHEQTDERLGGPQSQSLKERLGGPQSQSLKERLGDLRRESLGKRTGSRRLLRTHTSPVQIRSMRTLKPPLRIIAPGRTFRCDSDMTHTPMFNQVEGLMIDETTHLGHLKWLLEEFCKAFFENDRVKMRFRSSYFPFTEPSMEVDINCHWEKGQVKIGEGESWLEILGSGMVHPVVLRACDLDPEKYQGFAFGMGLDRIAMLKYGIPDLRDFFESDLRWLRHYGFKSLMIPNLLTGLS